jgi:CubicO group peptidase (beta-lactamase class C family)
LSDKTHYASSSPALREYLLALMAERSIPGLQVAIVREGRIEVLDTLGFANLEHRVPATHESIFSINSMAKAFTGVAVMQLVESGQLDLSAPMSCYLDGLPEAWRPITVRQLATLTSGLPEIMVYTADSSVTLIGDGSEEGAWQTAYASPMEYPTGKGYSYNQTNYALLGKVIDRLSGRPFTEFIAERQFAVAGMPNTRYFNDKDIVRNRANTYMCVSVDGKPTGRVVNSHINWPPILRTAAGLHSTAEDLANWVIALQRGALLKHASSIETMRTPVPLHDGRPGIWGIGWLVGRSVAGRVAAPAGGAKAQIVLYQDGTAVVLLANLIGAFQEQLAPVTANEIDLTFIDRIAGIYAS